jgi:hypothetical protein
MRVVERLSLGELSEMAEQMYGSFVKADVDVAKEILIVGMELHADGEAELLDQGSKQADLWGINLYPAKFGTTEFVEFDSMINIRPSQGNFSRGVEDPAVREKIQAIVAQRIHE